MMSLLFLAIAAYAATAVHEFGHLLAARARRAHVVRMLLGRGPRVATLRRGGVEYRLALFPIGGRVDYERPAAPTANAVIAIGGAVANVVFGFLLLLAAALVSDVGRLPLGSAAASPIAYAIDATSTWIRALPLALLDLGLHGDAAGIAQVMTTLRGLAGVSGVGPVLHAMAALSITWAALNMIPIPGLRTDGWQFVISLHDSIRAASRTGRDPSPER